jgi:hypothetical protein
LRDIGDCSGKKEKSTQDDSRPENYDY